MRVFARLGPDLAWSNRRPNLPVMGFGPIEEWRAGCCDSVTKRTERAPVAIFHVQGDIDAASYEAFEQRARRAIAQGARHLLVDLRQVDYL